MGPVEDSTHLAPVQQHGGGKRPTRRPRTRACLLKGCERRFRPVAARQRYCSPRMPASGAAVVAVEGAAELPGDGGGQRKTPTGKAGVTANASKSGNKRRSQKPFRKPRGSSLNNFFRALLRPAWLLRGIRRANRDRRCGASVHGPAGAPWNASGSASGAGARRRGRTGRGSQTERQIIPTY